MRETLALRAWDLMGGEINWSALPLVVELLGVDDVRMFVLHLTVIRAHEARQAAADSG